MAFIHQHIHYFQLRTKQTNSAETSSLEKGSIHATMSSSRTRTRHSNCTSSSSLLLVVVLVAALLALVLLTAIDEADAQYWGNNSSNIQQK
jgi:hypothetical protein